MFKQFLAKLRESRATKVSALQPKDPAVAQLFGASGLSSSGVHINNQTALRLTAVYAAVTTLAETISMLPIGLFRRGSSGIEELRDDPRHMLISDRPNSFQNSMEWRETTLLHHLITGHGVSRLVRDGAGNVREMVPLSPERLRIVRSDSGAPGYIFRPLTGADQVFLQSDVVDIRGPAWDSLCALNPIFQNSDSLGSVSAAESFAGGFFSRGARLSGFIEAERSMSPGAQKNLRDSIAEMITGLSNMHKIPILEEGVKFKSTQSNPEEAQLLDTRKWGITTIARMFRVPPSKLGDLEKATFNNIEQQNLSWAIDSLLPRIRRLENSLEQALLLPEERKTLFVKVDVNELLRGDVAARGQWYRTLWNIGALSANDIRRREGETSLGTVGDRTFVPRNMIPVDQLDQVGNNNSSAAKTRPNNKNKE